MFAASNDLFTLLTFLRSIIKSADPIRSLNDNQRASRVLDSLLKQVQQRLDNRTTLFIDQRFENLLLGLAFFIVELNPSAQIRKDILQLLLRVYERIPEAVYYPCPMSSYEFRLPPAEVFSFAFHTALTEIAATASDSSGRKQILRVIGHGIRQLVEYISRLKTDDSSETSSRIYRFQMPFLFGALRSVGRISNDKQSLMSQLYPMNFVPARQKIDNDDPSATQQFLTNLETIFCDDKSKSRGFVKPSSSNFMTTTLEDELPFNKKFFLLSGSTYHPNRNLSFDRFHICLTVSILEHFHETLLKFDHHLVKSLDKLAANEYVVIQQSETSILKSCFPYNHFGETLILVIMKFFRDHLELMNRYYENHVESRSRSRAERLASITRSIFSFVQQAVKVRLLNLDINEYEHDHQKYRTRVEANAVALELLSLSCYDSTEAEKLSSKCIEKFSQETSGLQILLVQMPLLITSFEVLYRLATKYSSLMTYTTRAFVDFLTEPSAILIRFYRHVYQHVDEREEQNFKEIRVKTMFEKLRDKAIEVLCKSLEIQYENDSTCLDALMAQLSAKLSFDKDQPEKLLINENIILTMSQLTKTFPYESKLSDSISTRFQRCLIDAPSSVAVLVIDRLASFLIDSSTTQKYGEIIRLFTTIIFDGANLPSVVMSTLPFAFNPATGDCLKRSQAVVRALVKLASQIDDQEELSNLLTNVLEIFGQLGLRAKCVNEKTTKNNGRSNVNFHGLLNLLGVVGMIANRIPMISDPSQRLFRLFQHFWFYSVLYKFTSVDTSFCPQVYKDTLKLIATKSPTLVNENFSDLTLKAAIPLKIETINKQDVNDLKSQMNTIFESYPTVRTYIDRFNLEQCLYILSIYYLETYRVRHDSNPLAFQQIFHYLEDSTIIRDKFKLWHVIMAIGRISFEIYIARMKKMNKTSERNAFLEQQCQFLMIKRTNVRTELRDQSKSHLHLLLSANGFPHLSCSAVVIETLMNILDILSYSLNDDNLFKVTTKHRVPNTSYQIQFADTRVKRQNLFETFVEFGRTLVEQALRLSPSLLKASIQQFMLKLEQEQRNPNAVRQHRGLHIMWEYISHYSQSSRNQIISLTFGVDFADYIVALAERSAAMGFTQGLDRDDYPSALKRLQNDIEKQIRHRCESVENYKSLDHRNRRMSIMAPRKNKDLALDFEQRIAVFDNQMRNTLFKLTAMLINNGNLRHDDDDEEFFAIGMTKTMFNENPLDRLIIHALTWLPMKMFTTAVMEAAVDCWSWAIVGRPQLEILIVQEIGRAWEKLMNERQGLYAVESTVSSPLAPSEKNEILISSINPHRIFFKFIEERVYLAIHRSDFEMEILVNLLEKSLSTVPMSRDINAFGLRFRLLSLVLYLIQTDALKSSVTKSLLRKNVFQSAFDYFTIQHRCPTQKSEDLFNDLRKMIQFFHCVHQEKIIHDETFSSPDENVPSKNSSLKKLRTSFVENRPSSSSSLSELKRSIIRRSSSSTSSHKTDLWSSKKQSVFRFSERTLLLTLLAYEIERLETFYNPLARAELNFVSNEYTTYHNWKLYDLPTLSKRKWKHLAQIAWQISPDLAVVFYQFCSKKSVRQEIQLLIKQYPRRVRHIPEALSIFTRHAEQLTNAQSAPILTWQSINPVAALAYFASTRLNHMNNSYTIQYASKILCTTNSEALILYIPQLVQAIRHDEVGFVRRLLLDLSKKSNLLAHQLIWNIRTNMFRTETTPDEEMHKKLAPILEQIEQNFTENAKAFYQRVFAFSDQLTKVSDTIKSHPKGNARKQACLNALREIGSEVPAGVYLPSNPEAIVISLDPESGAPMQSAEKAPYRATFRVQTVGIDQVERCADPNYEFMHDSSRQYSQMAIFKVGDDVRQDILALQLMRLFQNIFEQEGLELYLYTYRVIATSPGCGVIECVPNSRSREEIGRNTAQDLFDYFVHTYGKKESIQFQHARRNFVMSMAAYSVALFLLQIKDRHNGNIMIDDDGHIIHIDFGFLFESSPGGNIGFEPDLKLTAEMILIMDDLDSPAFLWYKELCIKGYLALRPYRQCFLILVALMLETGYPCFRGKTLEQFEGRFKPDSNEVEAAQYMEEVIDRCTHNIRTRLYDYIQYKQNSIPY